MTTKSILEPFDNEQGKPFDNTQGKRYKPGEIEAKWQKLWEEKSIYSTDMKRTKKPYYNLMMFPYPSAEGLHVGNMYAFTGVDVHGRFMRMRGYDVFEPIGLDGFGIHSENYALKVGRTPHEHARISQENFYRQLHATGNAFDWRRTLETYDPDYYRWTQWLFVEMFKHGLAVRAKALVNWCPSCKTVLADEQVLQKIQIPNPKSKNNVPQRPLNLRGGEGELLFPTAGVKLNVCERCDTVVERKELEQWFFRITVYAERLLQNTYKASFNWTNKVKLGQRNWIGKKEGINIKYQIQGLEEYIEVFTTAPVNFGMTFLVMSPEYKLVRKILDKTILITSERYIKVKKYVVDTLAKTDDERKAEGREKTGVFTGLYVINPVNNQAIPVWISDFVVSDVGTGAVQGCPGHDFKDFEFAKKFGIPIPRVVVGPDGDTSDIDTIEKVIVLGMKGKMINSDFLNGLEFAEAMQKTMDYFEKKGWGKRVVAYHLRDWLISRQRYWGAPIPMVYCKRCASKGLSWFTSKEAKTVESRIKNYESRKENSPQPHPNPLLKGEGNGSQRGDNSHYSLFMIHDSMKGWYPVPEDQLPVLLPDVNDWKPTGTGRGPLAGHPEFYKTTCPHCGNPAERETDVCDTFLDSSWYYLKYPFVSNASSVIPGLTGNPKIDSLFSGNDKNVENKEESFNLDASDAGRLSSRSDDSSEVDRKEFPWDNEITKKWFPVDSYIGGAEHTVLHLLYTRFVWMALRDWGYLEVKNPEKDEFDPEEPFKRFYAHGLIIKDGVKMSKSKGNVVVPDEYIKLYGADTLRTYLMFLGPFDQGGDFRDSGIAGMYKWLSRVWRLVTETAKMGKKKSTADSPESLKMLHRTIKGVTVDLDGLRYNTAISKLMEFTNWWMEKPEQLNKVIVTDFLKLLAPFAPHMTEELWQQLKVEQVEKVDEVVKVEKRKRDMSTLSTSSIFSSIHTQPWPIFDKQLVKQDNVSLVIQVNGKMRDLIVMSVQDANQQVRVEQMAKSSAKVAKWLVDKPTKKIIFIPRKLINFVI